MKEVYLDNSATTKPLPQVIDYMTEALTTNYGNPSSLHNKGLAAEKTIKKARESIARKLGVSSAEIYFTSGGTESNNLAIKGVASHYQHRGRHLITTGIEHSAVLESFLALEEEDFEVTYLPTDRYGQLDLATLEKAIRPDTILVSLFHVNNELGTILPIAEIGRLIKGKNKNTFFHIDAIQSFGKILLTPAEWAVDLLSISAHKIHGPKGIGALFLRKGLEIKPLLLGGGQESGLRSGTENMPGIAGFIPAVEHLPDFTEEQNREAKTDQLKKYFMTELKKYYPGAVVNSPTSGAPHILSVSFPGLKGEVLVHSLASKGIYVSTGSACYSKSNEKNHVLREIKLPPSHIDGTLRFSFSSFNNQEEIDYTISVLLQQIELFF
ncbi:MAG: cysteine desulfurase [Halanaerobiales bacterium]|nr:cysteine desulfurase [Halanaerobiales bacterium]